MDLGLDLAVQLRETIPGVDFAFTTADTRAAFLLLAHLPGNQSI